MKFLLFITLKQTQPKSVIQFKIGKIENLLLVLSEWKSAKVVRMKFIMKHLLKMYKKYTNMLYQIYKVKTLKMMLKFFLC